MNQIVKENPKEAERWEALRKEAAARLREALRHEAAVQGQAPHR